jgi:hypothetical protein
VTYDDGDHQVVGLSGTSVRLRSATGAESVVLASHLMAAPDFTVTGTEPLPAVERRPNEFDLLFDGRLTAGRV